MLLLTQRCILKHLYGTLVLGELWCAVIVVLDDDPHWNCVIAARRPSITCLDSQVIVGGCLIVQGGGSCDGATVSYKKSDGHWSSSVTAMGTHDQW